jgi:hypothetical protein
MFKIPHCLDNWLTDGGEVVSLTRRPRSTPQKHFFFLFLVLISVIDPRAQGLVWLEGLGKLKKFNDLIRTRICDIPACSIVPQPLHYHVFGGVTVLQNASTRVPNCMVSQLKKCYLDFLILSNISTLLTVVTWNISSSFDIVWEF